MLPGCRQTGIRKLAIKLEKFMKKLLKLSKAFDKGSAFIAQVGTRAHSVSRIRWAGLKILFAGRCRWVQANVQKEFIELDEGDCGAVTT